MSDTTQQREPLWSDSRIADEIFKIKQENNYPLEAAVAMMPQRIRDSYETRLAAAERERDTALRSLNLWLEQVEIDTATINKLGIERDNLAKAIERATQLHKRQEDELADCNMAVHIQQKSLDEYAATIATLRQELADCAAQSAAQGKWLYRGDASIEVYGGGLVAVRLDGPFPQGPPPARPVSDAIAQAL